MKILLKCEALKYRAKEIANVQSNAEWLSLFEKNGNKKAMDFWLLRNRLFNDNHPITGLQWINSY